MCTGTRISSCLQPKVLAFAFVRMINTAQVAYTVRTTQPRDTRIVSLAFGRKKGFEVKEARGSRNDRTRYCYSKASSSWDVGAYLPMSPPRVLTIPHALRGPLAE